MAQGVDIPRVAALDGLRGAAVAGVLLFHGGYLTGGYLGVDLFFVLSGFLITSLLLAESGSSGRIGLGSFWARRARRLLPALGGLMVGVAIYCLVFAAPGELAQIRGDALATLGYVANWRALFASQDYFALFQRPSPLQHTWSLAIEEQFYLVWPLVFVGLLVWWKRSAPKAVLVVAVGGAVASSVLMFVLYDPVNVSRDYYGTDTRAAGILMGAALAAALTIWGPVRGRVARAILGCVGGSGIVVLAVAWTRLGGQSESLYRGGFAACGLAAIAVIATVAHPQAGFISRALSWRPLCLLGLISYGVYLWHWPVYVVLDAPRTGLDGVSLLGVRIAVTLVIAVASYVFLEQPIRHGAGAPAVWRVLTPAVAIVLVALLIGATDGAKAPAAAAASPDAVGAAVNRAGERGATKIMIVGDSVSYEIGVGMKEIQTKPSVVVLNRGIVACTFPHAIRVPLPTGQAFPDIRCDQGWTNAVRQFRPDVVLAIFQCCSGSFQVNGKWVRPCDREYADAARPQWRDALAIFGQTGAHVFVATSPYALSEVFHAGASHDLDCSNAIRVAAARSAHAGVIDLADWTCPGAPGPLSVVKCPSTTASGVVLRPDNEHFRGEGARIVSRWLLSKAGVVRSK